MEPTGDETTDDEITDETRSRSVTDGPLSAQFLTQRDCCLYRERLEATVTDGGELCKQLRQLPLRVVFPLLFFPMTLTTAGA